MNPSSMETQLRRIIKHTLQTNPLLHENLHRLCKSLNLPLETVIDAFVHIDTDFSEIGNKGYEVLSVRGAFYIKQFIDGSFHKERQDIFRELVAHCKNKKCLVEIGYGAPGEYIHDIIAQENHITLLDFANDASLFAKAFLDAWYPRKKWEQHVNIDLYDFRWKKSPGTFDVYMLFDSIEHTEDPDGSFAAIVKGAPRHAEFLLSLPIGAAPPVAEGVPPIHYIEWMTDAEGRTWLNDHGLVIEEEWISRPQKNDLYFHYTATEPFHNLIVRCKKK